MDSSTWICYLLPLFVLFMIFLRDKNKKKKIRQHIRNKKGLNDNMDEIINKFMNKGVCVTTIDDNDTGRLVGFNDGWITLSNKGAEMCINTEYIVKIEEYKLPEDKKKNSN